MREGEQMGWRYGAARVRFIGLCVFLLINFLSYLFCVCFSLILIEYHSKEQLISNLLIFRASNLIERTIINLS